VPVTLGKAVDIGTPQTLGRNPNATAFSPAADGKRFLTALPAGGSNTAAPITTILNWVAALKR